MELSDIPTASISMPCAPFVDERGKLIAWQDAKNPVARGIMDNVARITRFVSAPLFANPKLRGIVAAIAERTGAQVALSGSPWKIEKGEFVSLEYKHGEFVRLESIAEAVMWWHRKLGRNPDWLTWYDEAERITDDNRDDVLARAIRLWQCVKSFVGTVATYNARMVREKDVYPFTHPLTPGPSHCSLYLNSNLQNARNLAATKARLAPWNVPLVANVILNKWKLRNSGRYNQGYLPTGAEPEHFRGQGEIIRKIGCSAVVISECPLLLNGKENPDVVANFGAIAEGIGVQSKETKRDD